MEATTTTHHNRYTVTVVFQLDAGIALDASEYIVEDNHSRSLTFDAMTGRIVSISAGAEFNTFLDKSIIEMREVFKQKQIDWRGANNIKPESEATYDYC